jgi:2-polyprenyl-3-methyl-5-hydroxy-6-metoxy-1,4-benzoquinol methylase
MIREIISFLLSPLLFISYEKRAKLCSLIIRAIASPLGKKDNVRFLLELDNYLRQMIEWSAKAYGNGVSIKHKIMNYHDFFIQNIKTRESILDIGCGDGFVTYQIAKSFPKNKVVGIDMSDSQIEKAEKNFKSKNLKFIVGEAPYDLLNANFEVVILSNVLEHIKNRGKLLLAMKTKIKPKKLLIRVPAIDRSWIVGFKKLVKINYFLDKTHYIEYSEEELVKELNKAGLKILKIEKKYGEFWLVTSFK